MAAASRLREMFGHRFHLELWNHGMPGDDASQRPDVEVAQRLGLGVVATNQVHYAHRKDADLAEVLAAIRGRRSLEEADGFRPATDLRHLRHPDEMERLFARYPGVVARTAELGERLAFDLALVAPRLPDFPMPGHFRSEMEYLRHLTWEGARTVYPGEGEGGIDPAARRRLEHELGIIERLGFAGYFLVVWDIVRYARSQDIYCQIRGSGADSAVCRCLGLTRVDPIRLGLPFERFLSEERGRAPDIDLDLEADRREEVIQYCYRRYGRERAARSPTSSPTGRSRCCVTWQAFGFTPAQVDELSKYVDTRNPAHLRSEVPLPAGLTAELIYDVCHRLDGFPRHLGIHSGGMVISDRPLWQVVPLEWGRMEGRTVIQWDKDDSAAVGMVKFDLLGLGMLNALHLTVDLIDETHGVAIDLAAIDQEPVIYDMLGDGDTIGLFQVESRAQIATLPRMRPRTFYDLAIEVALIRPGPIQGQSVHPYLRRRSGEEPVRYPHPSTEPILAKTLGVPIFQEQLMELARVCAGFDGGQSDRLRQAMTHKRSEEAMARLRDEVYEGMARNGITGAAADEIWEKLQAASFGFPESHSVSFAYIVYVGVAPLPLAVRVPVRAPQRPADGLLLAQQPRQDAQRHGVVVYGPTSSTSPVTTARSEPIDADPDDIVTYMGRSWRRGRGQSTTRSAAVAASRSRYVRNLGEKEIARIETARMVGGPFTSPEDLAWRTGLSVDALQSLAATGALRSIGLDRRPGIWAAGALADIDPGRLPLAPGVDAPDLPDMSEEEAHRADLWGTGISPRHPIEFIRDALEADGCLSVAEVLGLRRPVRVKVAGVVTHRQRPDTASGVIFFNLEDETGQLNVIVLPEVWERYRPVARKAAALVIEGRVEHRHGVTNLIAQRMDGLGVYTLRSRDFR